MNILQFSSITANFLLISMAMCYASLPVSSFLFTTNPLPSLMLPFVVHLNSFVFFAVSSFLFLFTWTYNHGGRELKQFSGGKYSPFLYGTFFYLLPTVEYFAELIYCPVIKKWAIWALDVTEPSDQLFIRQIICCFVYLPICSLYWAVNLNRSYLFVSGDACIAAQSILELLMHVIAQV